MRTSLTLLLLAVPAVLGVGWTINEGKNAEYLISEAVLKIAVAPNADPKSVSSFEAAITKKETETTSATASSSGTKIFNARLTSLRPGLTLKFTFPRTLGSGDFASIIFDTRDGKATTCSIDLSMVSSLSTLFTYDGKYIKDKKGATVVWVDTTATPLTFKIHSNPVATATRNADNSVTVKFSGAVKAEVTKDATTPPDGTKDTTRALILLASYVNWAEFKMGDGDFKKLLQAPAATNGD